MIQKASPLYFPCVIHAFNFQHLCCGLVYDKVMHYDICRRRRRAFTSSECDVIVTRALYQNAMNYKILSDVKENIIHPLQTASLEFWLESLVDE